ncbi:MAG: hypothetical protein KDE22_05445 [Rhodobacterales bacterium]|nr:hypothetical protein [Rhodobacterales bacterium]
MSRRAGLPVLLLCAAALLSGPARAQTLGLGGGGGNDDTPIEIFADNGLEWQQQGQVFVAQGNARAVRGDVTVHADRLRAFYRDEASGKSGLWRLDATGGVRIVGAQQTAYGDQAVYDVDQQVLVLSGGRPRIESATDRITADQQIEYWDARQIAVARGNAVAVREDRRLKADVLVAHFAPDTKGKTTVELVEAFDHVQVNTATEQVTANRGTYRMETGIATLTGSVIITRGQNRLTGCTATVNLNTGVSRLRGCGGDAGDRRVRGVILPRELKDQQ